MITCPRCLRAIHNMWQRKTLASHLLLPFSWLVYVYIVIKRWRFRHYSSTKGHPPIVVVGNILVGGTGKTPVVMAVLQALKQRGWQPGVISRGYGATIHKTPAYGRGAISPTVFGDEPALIAHTCDVPVAVHPNRLLALSILCKQYPDVDVVVSDDGLQHLALPRTIEIVVQDERGIGNGRLLPAGPLREPPSRLENIDFLIHNCTVETLYKKRNAPTKVPQTEMRLVPDTMENLVSGIRLSWADWLKRYAGQSSAAVAAIGQPERFFSMLRSNGLQPGCVLPLPDHADYQNPPFGKLDTDHILITAKDAVKCRDLGDPRLWIVHADVQFSDKGAWLDKLADKLADK